MLSNSKYENIVLTFDLEYWYESSSIKEYLCGDEKESLKEFIDRILQLLFLYKATATFFITGKVINNEPELIKKINNAGHEIAIHCLDHLPLWSLPPEKFDEDIKLMIRGIQKIIGIKPIGHRAVNFSLDHKTSWALKILEKHGLKYDSSIFPFKFSPFFFFVYRKFLYGIKSNLYSSYRIKYENLSLQDQNSLMLEIPLSIFHIGFFKLPLTGGIYIRFLPWFLYKILLKYKLKKEMACIHFHPFDFMTQIPSIKIPAIKKFIKYYNTKKTLKKFEYILLHYSCVSAKNYIKERVDR